MSSEIQQRADELKQTAQGCSKPIEHFPLFFDYLTGEPLEQPQEERNAYQAAA